ncbi:hypothetical protein WJ32_25645 [Burkholderia ubonensis]|uniref:Uncharacterized protein n=1 Tax=Burkholderia ubonensis TaxID=101571 RepID=A0A124RBS1_9BURK|nr:hypothetical protein WJ32_25645 [Burkholderia ubonensis]KVG68596.1 hypothetical protein WJ33_00140 [Burkholderia ubonensis]
MPNSACAASAVKHAMPPRPVVGAQLVSGRDWLPESITVAPNGCQRGPSAVRSTSPTPRSRNQDRHTNGEAAKWVRICASLSAKPRVSRQTIATTAPCNAGGAGYSRL